MTTMRYCPDCGTQILPGAAFCATCGRRLRESADPGTGIAPASENYGQAVTADLRYRISLNRIFLMTFLTYGLYLFYWFYLTWKQYRDHTREEAFPVWHALTLVVPIYGLFRTHAHARIFRELMTNRGLMTTISPGLAVAAVVASSALSWSTFGLSWGDMTLAAALTTTVIEILSIAIVAWLLMRLQDNLNNYWHEVSSGRLIDAKIGVGEVIFAVIGGLAWLDTLATLFSESYRLDI